MQQRGFVAVIFLIGCATGGVASQLAVPAARAGSAAPRWEYYCAQVQRVSAQQLNTYGAEGWELVSLFPSHLERELVSKDLGADEFAYCFKRPLP